MSELLSEKWFFAPHLIEERQYAMQNKLTRNYKWKSVHNQAQHMEQPSAVRFLESALLAGREIEFRSYRLIASKLWRVRDDNNTVIRIATTLSNGSRTWDGKAWSRCIWVIMKMYVALERILKRPRKLAGSDNNNFSLRWCLKDNRDRRRIRIFSN